MVSMCVFACVHKQDKLSFALERVEVQMDEATCFQRQTNQKILLIKVFKSALLSVGAQGKSLFGLLLVKQEFLVDAPFCVLPPDP